MHRRTLRFGLFIVPPLLLLGALAWVFWLRGGPEPTNVTIYEGNLPVAVGTRSQALDEVAERAGFVPIMPSRFLLPGLSLVAVRAVLPPDVAAGAERTHLIFSARDPGDQRLTIVAQSPVYWGSDLAEARQIDIGVGAVEVFALQAPGSAAPQFWLRTDGIHVSILLGGQEPISDAKALPMLRSIAGQMR
jgi:hypothetical protein